MDIFIQITSGIGRALLSIWWLWLSVLFGWLFLSLWLAWKNFSYKSKISWAYLEIQIPREIGKGPKAMDQILANLSTLRNVPATFKDKWIDGEVTEWFSLEIVSFGGEIHFYIRTPEKHRNFVESSLYAQYSDIEVREVDDYFDRLPATTAELYESSYGLWGEELALGKDNSYPVRTYVQFESDVDEQNIDPASGLLEVLSRLKADEIATVQILARPADPEWIKAIGKEIEKIKKQFTVKVKKAAGMEDEVQLTPGATDMIKQMELKGAKGAFEFMLRYLYFAPEEGFVEEMMKRGIRSAFNQYATPNLNYFLPNIKTVTYGGAWYKAKTSKSSMADGRKQQMLFNYRARAFPPETFMGKLLYVNRYFSSFDQKFSILNTEELATIFHLPTSAVLTQPLIKRVESRRIGPPAGLPIFQDQQEPPGLMK